MLVKFLTFFLCCSAHAKSFNAVELKKMIKNKKYPKVSLSNSSSDPQDFKYCSAFAYGDRRESTEEGYPAEISVERKDFLEIKIWKANGLVVHKCKDDMHVVVDYIYEI